jgi:hypothetical protein
VTIRRPRAVAGSNVGATSGWRDPAAFATRVALEAGISHLLTGAILGTVCGAVGGWMAVVYGSR